jgi:hypothetical protein
MLAPGSNQGYTIGDTSDSVPAQHYKEGYSCFSKAITADGTTGSVDIKTL